MSLETVALDNRWMDYRRLAQARSHLHSADSSSHAQRKRYPSSSSLSLSSALPTENKRGREKRREGNKGESKNEEKALVLIRSPSPTLKGNKEGEKEREEERANSGGGDDQGEQRGERSAKGNRGEINRGGERESCHLDDHRRLSPPSSLPSRSFSASLPSSLSGGDDFSKRRRALHASLERMRESAEEDDLVAQKQRSFFARTIAMNEGKSVRSID